MVLLSEAIRSTDEVMINEKRHPRGQGVYTESIGHARVDPEVALNRFIDEVFNQHGCVAIIVCFMGVLAHYLN